MGVLKGPERRGQGTCEREHNTDHHHGSEPGDEGLVYYVDAEGSPRGVLLWNLFGRVEEARELIRAGEPIQHGALRERV